MQTNKNKGADKFQSAAQLGNRGNNGINTFCGKEIDSTLDKKDVMSAKFSALNHLNDIMGFDTHNSNGYIIRLIVDKGERARLLDEINKENRMDKENTKSAGVSHPAANMADLGKNIDKNTMATKFIPTIATIVTNTITPNTDIYNGKVWYNWEELNVTGYEGVLEVAHQLCDILHHHAKEIVEAEGVTNPDEVLFAPLLDKYVSLHGCAWFKPSCDEYYHEYRIHNRYDGVICYGGLHLSDWLTKPTGQRFSNIVGCLLLDELDTVATDLHKKDYEEIYNASPFARAHWSSYEEMQKFIAIREANNKANPNGMCLWSKATYEEHGYTFNHELIA